MTTSSPFNLRKARLSPERWLGRSVSRRRYVKVEGMTLHTTASGRSKAQPDFRRSSSVPWRRGVAPDEVREKRGERDGRPVFPHRGDDLNADRKTRRRLTNRSHGGRQSGEVGESRPIPHYIHGLLAIGRLDSPVFRGRAVIMRECDTERCRKKKHIMALEVLLPEDAGIHLAPRLGDPTAVRIHRNSSRQIIWICL